MKFATLLKFVHFVHTNCFSYSFLGNIYLILFLLLFNTTLKSLLNKQLNRHHRWKIKYKPAQNYFLSVKGEKDERNTTNQKWIRTDNSSSKKLKIFLLANLLFCFTIFFFFCILISVAFIAIFQPGCISGKFHQTITWLIIIESAGSHPLPVFSINYSLPMWLAVAPLISCYLQSVGRWRYMLVFH